MEASLSRETGMWDGYRWPGACEVTISPDERWAVVRFCNGHMERVRLPKPEQAGVQESGSGEPANE